jgi:hypothetical protein
MRKRLLHPRTVRGWPDGQGRTWPHGGAPASPGASAAPSPGAPVGGTGRALPVGASAARHSTAFSCRSARNSASLFVWSSWGGGPGNSKQITAPRPGNHAAIRAAGRTGTGDPGRPDQARFSNRASQDCRSPRAVAQNRTPVILRDRWLRKRLSRQIMTSHIIGGTA